MAKGNSYHVTLPPALATFAEEAVKAGRYRSVAEVIRDGVRHLQDRHGALEETRAEIDRGRRDAESGRIVDGEEALDRVKHKLHEARKRTA